MRTPHFRLLAVLTAVVLAAALQHGHSRAAEPLRIEPFVWQMDVDYPPGTPADRSLPVDTVYIKTHDATDWMSAYDAHPWAVSGPGAIQNLVNAYGAQGIQVAAWFVPKGNDYDTQFAMALQVIDSGVTALYADVEPYQGFCYHDCVELAQNFWARVRQARPQARLGVIYDPRPWWWDMSGTSLWFANSDVAMPMCYWDDYTGQVPWSDAGGCVAQAKADLSRLAPGHALEYLPVLQGDSSPDRVQQALDAAVRADAQRVSLWRRGVVSTQVWSMISAYEAPSGPHCATQLVDGCLVREASQPAVYLIEGGAKFPFPSGASFEAMGFDWRDVQVLPFQMTRDIPDVPADGTLVKDPGFVPWFVVYGGAKFGIPSGQEFDALGLNWNAIRTLPPGGTAQIPDIPADYGRFRELTSEQQYVVLRGGRIPLDEAGQRALSDGGHGSDPLYIVPSASLEQVPIAQIKRGDADCDGTVAMVDTVRVLQGSIGIPNPGICTHISGDVTCDGLALVTDAFLILRYVAEAPFQLDPNCPPIGEMQPASLSTASTAGPPTPTPVEPAPTATGEPSPTASASPSATLTPSGGPTATASAPPSPTPSASPPE